MSGGGRGIKYIDSGEVCASLMGSAPGAIALSRGVDAYMPVLTVIGDMEMLIVRDSIDLAGKTIGTFVGSTADYHLRLILNFFGLNDLVDVRALDSDQEGIELWDAGVSAEFIQNKENPNFKAQLEEALSKSIPYMVSGSVNASSISQCVNESMSQ